MSDDYNIGAIRRLLTAAFDSGELRIFCMDRPVLRPVVSQFGLGMGLDDMVGEVIDFCRTRLLWDEMLAAVKEERPAQYKRFEAELGGSGQTPPLRPQPTPPAATTAPGSKIRILFLAANPRDTDQLRLGDEVRAIDQALRMAEFRDRFDLEQQWAVRVSDLQGLLLRFKPHVVHFSGHGSTFSEIILENAQGNAQAVPEEALAGLFRVLKGNIRCVVLNACYSKVQARAIAREIECVVGMSKAITDVAAINFSASFYQALAYGESVRAAFELGCLQINMEGLGEEDTPKLKTKRGVDAAQLTLIGTA